MYTKNSKRHDKENFSASLERYQITARYICKLWRLKNIRFEYFNSEMTNILLLIGTDIERELDKHRDVSELKSLRSEVKLLVVLASKISMRLMLSDQYLCERPSGMYRDLRRSV